MLLLFLLLFNYDTKKLILVLPSYSGSLSQKIMGISSQLISDALKENSEKYFPILNLLLVFILSGNLLGLIPYSFTITSHLMITFLMSFSIFVGVNALAISKHKMKFFSIFLPSGTTFVLALLLVPIEIVSHIAKPISLGVRLFINLMAGHTLLKVILMFSWNILILESVKVFLLIIPIIILILLVGLETGVALIQTYVFISLTCIYVHESEHLH
jgi:ATP synthase subunit 6